jgi:hypothetical protein
MKATHLRIGNLINFDGHIRMIAVVACDDTIRLHDEERGTIGCFSLKSKILSPLKIQDKLLESFGFRFYDYEIAEAEFDSSEDRYYRCFKKEFKHYDYLIDICPDGLCDFILATRYGDEILLARLKHIHELQNLYFAIQGKELEFINSGKNEK